MNKKSLLQLMAVMMVAMLSFGFVSCGGDDDDDNGGGKGNSVTNHIVGNWINGGMIVSFYNNGTGFVTETTSGNKMPNGAFKFGTPYEVETENGQTWFLIVVTYTSGESSGKKIEWEVGYQLNSDGDTEWINIEGTKFYEK